MLTLILVVALLVLLVTVLVAAMRRYDANNYFDQDRQPFYAEPDMLVAAGLLYSQKDRDRNEQRTYTVTPAGEAGLRAWLREPSNDPGFLEHHFAGLVQPFDKARIAQRRLALHRSRLAEYERIELLLVNRPEWRYALSAARIGVRFERRCLDFWSAVDSEKPIEKQPDGGEGEAETDGSPSDADRAAQLAESSIRPKAVEAGLDPDDPRGHDADEETVESRGKEDGQ
ncbi:hypothetical protein [Jiella marina]|uniref:hypothetical protein n=1 Tax=Jiella sp. LLJ827 TaxID=2917712 RepID=UPI002100B0D0|nr:hypothetical protein [Jiella sp. LLJ827]MCQ0986480.1 hypothetical protein [Jiella sp. LLJ827]